MDNKISWRGGLTRKAAVNNSRGGSKKKNKSNKTKISISASFKVYCNKRVKN